MKQIVVYRYSILCLLFVCGLLCSCHTKRNDRNQPEGNEDQAAKEKLAQTAISVEKVDTNGLIVLYPNYSEIDLVCFRMPQKSDSSVILFAEAAFSGQGFYYHHHNIAGDHVSSGQRYQGYRCRRNTGAFVFYNSKWKFCKGSYSNELDSAAFYGGAGFGQELILYNGSKVHTIRPDNNSHLFRALCAIDERLCIVQSEDILTFGSFKDKLVEIGVSDAIYLDMGSGWDFAWYRNEQGDVVELIPETLDCGTNWITFYK